MSPDNPLPDAQGLRLDHLVVQLEGQTLAKVNRTIAPGEVLTVMGPSGSGKTSLLAAITGTLPPAFSQSGRLWLNGRNLSDCAPHKRHIGILLQETLLFPHLSVGGNLAFGLSAEVRGRKKRREVIERALVSADLEGFFERDPETLSGGQKARVALLRTLLAAPRALLLDEPFSRLNTGLRRAIRDFVFVRAKEKALPVVLVTHDHEDADHAGGSVISPLGEPIDLSV